MAVPIVVLPASGVGVPGESDQRAHLAYVTASGVNVALTDEEHGFVVDQGPLGLGDLPYLVVAQDVPSRDGAILRGVRAGVRQVSIPMWVFGDTRADIVAKIRDLATQLDPRAGTGHLQVLEADGSGRQLPCIYTAGMEGDEGQGLSGPWWRKFVVTFTAYDPTWQDLTPVMMSWVNTAAVDFFPILPLVLNPSQVLGTVTVDNPGDERAFPLWTIVGPMTAVAVTNNTTGQTFTLTHTLADDTKSVVIDCSPGQLTVVDQDSANLWPDLDPNPQLWALAAGINSVTIDLTGSDVTSAATLTFTPRYKTA